MSGAEREDGRVSVRVAQNRQAAHLRIEPPSGAGRPVVVEEALRALAAAGVRHGLDLPAIEAAVAAAGQSELTEVLAAQATPPAPGQDAAVQLCEELLAPSGTPAEREDGGVDFFNLRLVRNVQAGTVLAQKEPPTQGIPGTDVTGAQIPAAAGKDVALRAGAGCQLSSDKLQVVALVDGHATLGADGATITVQPIFEVNGDVGTGTGHIEFLGTVIVRGSIRHGYKVKAGQDVEVHGGIDGGTVEAGGSVTVKFGIQGAGRGVVKAGGAVACRFLENADLTARGNVTVADGIMHSVVRSGGSVICQERRGAIIGGQVRARDGVLAKVVGAPFAAQTEIEVGSDPELRSEAEQLRQQLREREDVIRKASQAVTLLRDLEAKRPEEFTAQRRDMLHAALLSLKEYIQQREELLARRRQVEEALGEVRQATVRVADAIYPGARIIIGTDIYVVGDVIHHSRFYWSPEDGEVRVGPA